MKPLATRKEEEKVNQGLSETMPATLYSNHGCGDIKGWVSKKSKGQIRGRVPGLHKEER